MPNVPQYTPNQVSSAPLPAPRQNIGIASPDVYGAGIAEGVSRGHIAVANARRDVKDLTVTADVLTNMDEWIKKDDEARNGENGFMLRQGEKAKTSVEEYGEYNKKNVDDIASKIKDPETRQAFRNAVARRYQANNSALVSRRGQVLQQHTEDTIYRSVSIDRESAVSNFMTAVGSKNPDGSYNAELVKGSSAQLQQSIDSQKATIRHLYMDIKGASPDVAEAEVQKATDATVLMATQAMINKGHYSEANDYFNAMQPQMSVEARNRAEPLVKAGVDRQFEQATSKQIGSEMDAAGQPLNEKEIRARAEELTKDRPDLTEGVYNRSIQIRNQNIAAVAQEQTELYDNGYRKIAIEGLPYDDVVTVSDEKKMTPQQVHALRSLEMKDKGLSREGSLAAVTNHFAAMVAIESGAIVNRDEETGEVISTQEPSVPWVHAQAVTQGWTDGMLASALEKLKEKNTTPDVTYNQIENVVKANEKSTGMILEDFLKTSPNFVNELIGMLPKGKKANDTDIQQALTKMMVAGEDSKSFSNQSYWEAVRDGKGDEWIPDVPASQIKYIESMFEGGNDKLLKANKVTGQLVDRDGVVARRLIKYLPVSEGGMGYPTPYAENGQRMTLQQSLYVDIIGSAKRKQPAVLTPPKATPPKRKLNPTVDVDINTLGQ